MKLFIALITSLLLTSNTAIAEGIKMDTNKDGYVTEQEWLIDGRKRLAMQFEKMDVNHNGYLEPEEQGYLRMGANMAKNLGNLTQNGDPVANARIRAARMTEAMQSDGTMQRLIEQATQLEQQSP